MTARGDTITYARGWRADWLNGWLAAIGATVLLDGLRLSWTDSPRPSAQFHHGTSDLPTALWSGLPEETAFEKSATASVLPGHRDLTGKITRADFADRASVARRHGDWSLGALTSDAVLSPEGDRLPTAQFNIPLQGAQTMPDNARRCRREITRVEDLSMSMAGVHPRVPMAGLGFDARRLKNQLAHENKHWVDPVVEVLAWEAIALFPAIPVGEEVRSRGWTGGSRRPGAFTWGVWREPLDRWAIDAKVLAADWRAAWTVVPFRVAYGANDITSAFASRRVRLDG